MSWGRWDTGRGPGGGGEKEWKGKPTLWLLLKYIVADWEGIFICFTLRNLFFNISYVLNVPKKSQYAKTSPTGQKKRRLVSFSKSVIEFILIQRFRFLKCILRIGFIGFNLVGEKVLQGVSTLSPISDKINSAPSPPLSPANLKIGKWRGLAFVQLSLISRDEGSAVIFYSVQDCNLGQNK